MRVYIAGPMRLGNYEDNIRNAIAAMHKVIDCGHEPYCPHLMTFADIYKSQPVSVWMRIDRAFLETCQIFVRLPGVSVGADREELWAEEKRLKIFYSIEAFVDYYVGIKS